MTAVPFRARTASVRARRFGVVAAFLPFAAAHAASPAPLAALVLVNSGYHGSLATPQCAAQGGAAGAILRRPGSSTLTVQDGSPAAIRAAIVQLGEARRAPGSPSPVIYLCGRSATRNDRLFFLPVGATASGTDVLTQGILVGGLLDGLGGDGALFADLAPTDHDTGGAAAAHKLADNNSSGRLLVAVGADGTLPHAAADAIAVGAAKAGSPWDALVRPILAANHGDTIAVVPAAADASAPAASPAPTPATPDKTPPVQPAPAALTKNQPSASPSPAAEPPAAPPASPSSAAKPDTPPADNDEDIGKDAAATPDAAAKPTSPGNGSAVDAGAASPAGAAATDHPPSPPKHPKHPLQGDERVRRLQVALLAAGYFHGRVNGIKDGDTDYAIRAYQRSLNDSPTGTLTGSEVVRLLNGR